MHARDVPQGESHRQHVSSMDGHSLSHVNNIHAEGDPRQKKGRNSTSSFCGTNTALESRSIYALADLFGTTRAWRLVFLSGTFEFRLSPSMASDMVS